MKKVKEIDELEESSFKLNLSSIELGELIDQQERKQTLQLTVNQRLLSVFCQNTTKLTTHSLLLAFEQLLKLKNDLHIVLGFLLKLDSLLVNPIIQKK